MVDSATERVIREAFARLRLKPRPCTLSVGRKKYPGFVAPLKRYLDELTVDQRRFRALDVRFFQGLLEDDEEEPDERPGVFAIPALPRLELVKHFQVGTHNHMEPESAWPEIRAFLASIEKESPFDVVFADAAGLKADFVKPVPRKTALRHGARLVKLLRAGGRWMDSVMLMMSEAGPAQDKKPPPRDEFAAMASRLADFIVSQRRLRLWWD